MSSKYFTLITHPDQADATGFRARIAGLEVRDCLFVLKSEGPLCAILVRVPLESTVVEEVVRNGSGAMNINRGRIRLNDKDPNFRPNASKNELIGKPNQKVYGEWGYTADVRTQDLGNHNSKGRFPANLILVHGPSCVCEGTREIKTRSDTRPEDDAGRSSKREWRFTPTSQTKRGYGGEDGTEEVASWICEDGCPVQLMDEKSFAGGIHGAGHATRYSHDKGYQASSYDMSGERDVTRYGDEGGASRFFYQATSLDDLEKYLTILTGTDPK